MAEEKSEAATPRRQQKAREEGRVPISRELSMCASLAAGLLALSMRLGDRGIADWLAASLQRTRFDGVQGWGQTAGALLAVGVPAAASCLTYLAVSLAQSGFLLHLGSIRPDLGKISPLAGLKRLFGAHLLIEALKAIAKLVVLGGCLWMAIGRVLPGVRGDVYGAPDGLYRRILGQSFHLVFVLLGAQAAIALGDLLWQRWHHASQLRMSLQEVRDEHKENEGNPQVRQRLRGLMRARARRRMMQAVPKAAVVITNPTHYAVALSYERGSKAAPRLVAKGADEVAARIRDLARAHRIAMIANPPLARALYRVEIDTEIPAEHFRAVAEIIAYVWRMRARAMRR